MEVKVMTMPPAASLELKKLIDDREHFREKECGEYLEYVPGILARDQLIQVKCIEPEYRLHTGDSDYVISAEANANGMRVIRAYVWDLKAPQCFVFEKSTLNKACPSEALIDAETKLLHYYDDFKYSEARHDFGVLYAEDVYFGGIIIGCNRTKVKSEKDGARIDSLFSKAMRCRNYLYEHAKGGIRLMLWDQILDFIRGEEYKNEHSIEEEYPFETQNIVPGTITVFGDEAQPRPNR